MLALEVSSGPFGQGCGGLSSPEIGLEVGGRAQALEGHIP